MNDKIKNAIVLICSVILCAALAAGIITGIVLSFGKKTDGNTDEYRIVVDEEVDMYVGDEHALTPYLLGGSGKIVESRFAYESKDQAISVSPTGVITAVSVPSDGVAELVVTERNTETQVTVKVHVSSEFERVGGLLYVDADGNKVLAQTVEKYEMLYGGSYVFEASTEPSNIDLSEHTEIKVFEGETELDMFDVKYDGNKITLTPVGLGSGEFGVKITNGGRELYSRSFEFGVTYGDAALGNDILNSAGKPILDRNGFKEVKTLTVTSATVDLNDVKILPELETIVFTANRAVACENADAKYWYHVDGDLLMSYVHSSYFASVVERIIPYVGKYDNSKSYAVLHNDRAVGARDITYVAGGSGATLPTYGGVTGYLNTGWKKSNGDAFTDADLAALAYPGIHLYSVWEPIEFTINYYYMSDADEAVIIETDSWIYGDDRATFKRYDEITNYIKTGYLFSAWTVGTTTYAQGSRYSQLVVSNDNTTISVYARYVPIRYVIRLNNGYNENYVNINAIYDEDATLPTPERVGYSFVNWSDEVNVYNGGDVVRNLTATQDAVVELTATWQEHAYTLKLEYNGGRLPPDGDPNNDDETETSVVLQYTQTYRFPQLVHESYDVYTWVTTVPPYASYEPDAEVSKLTAVDRGTVTLRARWSMSASFGYKISFDFDGGSYNGGNDIDENTQYNRVYSDSYALPDALSKPDKHLKAWSYNGREYAPAQLLGGAALGITLDTREVVFTAVWEDATATSFGRGTQSDPWRIYYVIQLKNLATRINRGEAINDGWYRLENDLTAVGAMEPIGNNYFAEYYSRSGAATARRFGGHFDGGGHTVSGYQINVSGTDTYVGLFGYVSAGGVISNLKVKDFSVNGTSTRSTGSKGGAHHGAIAGLNCGTITDCEVGSGTVTGSGLDTHNGGIVGYMFLKGATVRNCKSAASVNGTARRCCSHGGIVGSANNCVIYNCEHVSGGVVNCRNDGSASYGNGVRGYNFLGGIAGVCCAIIVNCTNNGGITGGGFSYNGGTAGMGSIVGYLHNGSDANTNETGDNSLTIDKTLGPVDGATHYYCAVIGCKWASGGTAIGFLQGDRSSNENRSPIAVSKDVNIKAMGGSLFDRIENGSAFSAYINQVSTVSNILTSCVITLPDDFIVKTDDSFDGVATGTWDNTSWTEYAVSYMPYVILGVCSLFGLAGTVIFTVIAVRKNRARKARETSIDAGNDTDGNNDDPGKNNSI